ncbi:hypothetical protein PviCFBP13515_26245 [Pseudomonas viridiflava]|uniref:hypothetical protein n=1 Tax=Pseudomonas viridiflava TaxID=33069 RepID=UPI0010C13E58|nr:hypothetical protein [Pseudomonas viridiflava]TKJ54751.1 hypothetical protein PviCFBP13507_26525 [Pseudomonas viridiflava]TKK17107.1 hypothetical protein PviCFBP13515_26245 [Pseudomonas viridiflava]
MKIDIKILKKGDTIISILPYEGSVAIAVKRKQGHVEVVLITKNPDGIPEISSTWSISEGDNEIEVDSGDIKVSTF